MSGGTLIRRVSGASSIGYGVNIWEQSPPQSVQGVTTNVIAMVGAFPWGPQDTIETVYTPGDFFALFYPNEFATTKDYTTYPAVLALLSKPIFTKGGLKVVRIDPTSVADAKATSGAITAGTGSITITAKYAGLIGNGISYQWTTATGGDAAKRDLVITIGSNYTARYKNLAYTDTFSTAVDDPFVDLTQSSPSAMPSTGSATALASGADGTAVASDYVGTSSSFKGIRLFYGEGEDVNVLFVAECPSGIIDAVNTGVEAWVADTEKGVGVLSTVNGQTAADAITYVAGYLSNRLVYTWPRVNTPNPWNELEAVEVDGNAFAAALIANVDPWLSPGGAGKKQGTRDLLSGISSLETDGTSTSGLDALNEGGIAPWFNSRALGMILRKGVTTASTGMKIRTRRMTDYLVNTLAGYAEYNVERPLDLVLGEQTLGTWTGQLVSAWGSFLQNEKIREHIQNYSLDPFSENTQEEIDAGRWTIVLRVKLFADIDELVLKATVGETVEISES